MFACDFVFQVDYFAFIYLFIYLFIYYLNYYLNHKKINFYNNIF